MIATVVIDRNPFYPGLDREVRQVRRRCRLRALAPRTRQPFIATVNGCPALRATWNRRLRDGDVVAFVVLPQGVGGDDGKNPLGTVLSIGLMVMAPMVAPMFGFAAGTLGAGLITAGVSLAGGALINAAFGGSAPSQPSSRQLQELAAPSPTYSLQAQGNTARLEQPIPVVYGRHVVYPDFAAEPYVEYVGNEQYLYQLLVIGQGSFSIEATRIEDTSIASFPGITTQLIEPGGTVTLFPTDVSSSVEVTGQELLQGATIGPFVATSAGTTANYLGIDVVLSRGLYYANDAGGLDARSASFTSEARLIDDNGAPLGSFFALGSETVSGATTTPIRRSYKYAVSTGRYEVRVTRTDAKDTSSRAGNEISWAGMRAYIPGTQQYGNVTVLAMRMQASNSLSSVSSRRVNVIATRKLPTWSPGGGWAAASATRSIAWALADALRADYGAGLPDAAIDLAGLHALAAIWTTRGDTFNAVFDSKITLWEAISKIARAGRARPYLQGGVLRFARDASATVPVALFSPANIVAGSWKSEYLLPGADTPDAVEVTYFDEDWWRPKNITCAVDTQDRPARVPLFGITDRDQAWREGKYEAAANRYRRQTHSFTTEMEGFIPSPLDLIAIVRDRANWGQWSQAVAWNAVTKTLTLSAPPTWTPAASHFIALRKRDGGLDGPYAVTAGAIDTQVVLATLPAITPYTGQAEELTVVAFGVGGAYRHLARVVAIRPRTAETVEIGCVSEDDRVHSADGTAAPAAPPAWALPKVPTLPAVGGLKVTQGGAPAKPTIHVSWIPAPGAQTYLVEQSADNVLWTRTGDTAGTEFSFEAQPGNLYVRVAGMGLTRGAWAVSSLIVAGAGIATPGDTAISLQETFTGPVLRVKWAAAARAAWYVVEIWAGGVQKRSRVVYGTSYEYTAADAGKDGGPWRAMTVKVTPTAQSGAGATATLDVSNPQVAVLNNVTVTGLLASLIVEFDYPAVTDLGGFLVYVSTSTGFTPGPSNLYYDGPSSLINVDLNPGSATYYVRVAAYDAWGKDSLNLSGEFSAATTLITETQITDSAISTPKLAANSVTAAKISVTSLSAINANIGTVTAGLMSSNSGQFQVDLDNKFVLIKDASQNEVARFGNDGSGNYLARVKSGSASAVLTPNVGTVISRGEVQMPTALEANSTYGMSISLGATYTFTDLTVELEVIPETGYLTGNIMYEPTDYCYWESLTVDASTIYSSYRSATSTTGWKVRSGTDATTGRITFSAAGFTAGQRNNFIYAGPVPTAIWDKGNSSSGSAVWITAAKHYNILSRASGIVYGTFCLTYPVRVKYTIIAKNYQG